MSTGRVTEAVSLPGLDVSIERPGLYVVATPIGNLGDLTVRAARVLASVDVIFSEDTRHSRRLLDHYGITTPLEALHEHNEDARSGGVVSRLLERGQAAALISDAGTPLISDPGFVLVRAAHAAGLGVHAVPGPCAAIAALSISGLPTDRFVFEGFLPSQAKARSTRLAALAGETRTMVFYEAPHRIADTVAALIEGFGSNREAVIGRELTKRFESVYSGTLEALADRIGRDPDANRGEFVVMVAGIHEQTADAAELDRLLRVVLRETDRKSAVRIVTALSGCSRNQVYQASLAVNTGDGHGGGAVDAGD